MGYDNEQKFADGMMVRDKNPKLPDFYEKHLSINVEKFIEFLRENDNGGYVNIDLMRSKNGKPYAKLNDYKSKPKEDEDEINLDDIPM